MPERVTSQHFPLFLASSSVKRPLKAAFLRVDSPKFHLLQASGKVITFLRQSLIRSPPPAKAFQLQIFIIFLLPGVSPW